MDVYGAEMNLERGTGFEPATSCLEGRSSTAELPPRRIQVYRAPTTAATCFAVRPAASEPPTAA